jgi:hypothetical protein
VSETHVPALSRAHRAFSTSSPEIGRTAALHRARLSLRLILVAPGETSKDHWGSQCLAGLIGRPQKLLGGANQKSPVAGTSPAGSVKHKTRHLTEPIRATDVVSPRFPIRPDWPSRLMQVIAIAEKAQPAA